MFNVFADDNKDKDTTKVLTLLSRFSVASTDETRPSEDLNTSTDANNNVIIDDNTYIDTIRRIPDCILAKSGLPMPVIYMKNFSQPSTS